MKKSHRLAKFERSVGDSVRRFESVEKRRESLLKDSRDVLASCSKAIVSAHSGDMRSALSHVQSADRGLAALRTLAESDLDRYLSTAEMELVEAKSFLALLSGKEVPSAGELNVKPSSYVLGLLDAVGELKRKVFDDVRVGKEAEANRLFDQAEGIYSSLKPLAIFDNLVPGLRRKLDVDRVLLEDMRALITEEVRRRRLLDSLERLERNVKPGTGKRLR